MAAVAQICNPELYRLNQAIQKATSSAQDSPGFELDLARFLQAQCLSNRVSLPTVFRGLDILGGMMEGGVPDESQLTTLLGPFLGSVLGELAAGSSVLRSTNVGISAWLGLIFGTIIKLVSSLMMVALWALAWWLNRGP